uniref:Glycosyl transferase family 2 n=1 Tax=Pithovirus LCPAC404 TaxID=2506597 RepID=A0A481ZCC0_9VIRU|nr:MAG: glycosyl transferase family 2 [Pithovirus LCPAC404]
MSDTVTICTVIICKNESEIIKRCLDSTKFASDFWCVCDTGSTDNTVELIQEWFEENEIKNEGKVCNHKWVNFGHNRSLSIVTAKNEFPKATYHLHIDCDMILKVGDKFDKNKLTRPSYNITQKNGQMSYDNTRLTKSCYSWRSVGVTHEYLSAPGVSTRDHLGRDVIWIDDRNDGGCKADKFVRDYRLLKQGIKDEPKNIRYYFYIAQTSLCLGRYKEAIEWYNKRIAMGGYHEEIFYSYYKIGDCYQALKDWPNAHQAYLSGYNHTPSRSETLYEIVKHYRILDGQHKIAALYAKLAMKIKKPTDLYLFIQDTVYDYECAYEYSVIAYYIGDISGGIEASIRVLDSAAPNTLKNSVKTNFKFYKNGNYLKILGY